MGQALTRRKRHLRGTVPAGGSRLDNTILTSPFQLACSFHFTAWTIQNWSDCTWILRKLFVVIFNCSKYHSVISKWGMSVFPCTSRCGKRPRHLLATLDWEAGLGARPGSQHQTIHSGPALPAPGLQFLFGGQLVSGSVGQPTNNSAQSSEQTKPRTWIIVFKEKKV